MNPNRYLPRPLPEPLKTLADLAVDLRWSWNHSADKLWQTVDPELWEATGDPWLILESVSQKRLNALAEDSDFLSELQSQVSAREEYLNQPTWFGETYDKEKLLTVAYFSMEFGLGESLPIYSGGLGILAGDHLKTASDMGVPVVGIGLLYQQGYFRQALDTNGEQLAFFPYNNPAMLPVLPLWDPDGEWLRVTVELPGRTLQLRGWQAQVGRVMLYLLDSNDLLNAPGDRGITGELYGGGSEMRLQQEIVLGIGGWRLLEALNIDCQVCHLNEGHAAFAVLERAHSFMRRTQQPFHVALRCTRVGNVFTTHTPVEAGFDRFTPELISQYLETYAQELGITSGGFLSLGRADSRNVQELFNMAYLAIHGSGKVNGVSRLHGKVSRQIFQPLYPHWPQLEVPVEHVTNGVHVPSWDSAAADDLWTGACGKKRWLGTLEELEQSLRSLSDKAFWTFRSQGRQQLLHSVRRRLAKQSAAQGAGRVKIIECATILDPNTLTVGFARRFAGYKRPNLLLKDPERLTRLLTNSEYPLQLVIAGKAHPKDEEGRRMVRQWSDFIQAPDICRKVVFLADYDIALAAELVQGVDLWINTPRRPWEACGTSGMKVLVNGGLNLSELDGWWAEAYSPQVGWALGDGQEHENDPTWDAHEAEELYTLLEQQVIPAFYTRDEHGIPTQWVAQMRESMARLTPFYSTNRMVREYTEQYYLPGAAAYRLRSANNGALGENLEKWRAAIVTHWPTLHFGQLKVQNMGDNYRFQLQVYLNDLDPEMVCVELYAEPLEGDQPERLTMSRGEQLAGSVNSYLYSADLPVSRPATDYTPRIIPYHSNAIVPLEAEHILWQR